MSGKEAVVSDRRNPLKVALGLGAAHSGAHHWWVQRVTAAALVGLGIWFVMLVLSLLGADFAIARASIARPWNALLMIAFLLAMFWHAALGLQVVIEDYVHTRWREVLALVAVYFLVFLGAIAAVLAVLRIALTP
ncbi:MAG: succinate dehydrogenase, hydrophobic membrane anchor protein [Rhodanobacter sp.]